MSRATAPPNVPKERMDEWYKLFGECSQELMDKFRAFHAKNPAIFDTFAEYSREAKANGNKKLSHWLIMNRVRWFSNIQTTGKPYRISNDFIALYARLLIYKDSSFEGLFDLRDMDPLRKTVPK